MLTKLCELAHYHDSSGPGSTTVVVVFGRLALSDIVKPASSNATYLFCLEEQICNEQCPDSQKDHQHALHV
jgi:hypothetical protein